MKTKPYALVTTALAGVLFSGNAYAQTAVPTRNDAVQEVVVTGVRKSLQKSLNVKRAASAHIDVITAEDVSKFPDVNVAESLSRLPGITVDRSGGGEGEHIAINGINSRLINVTLNGNPIASANAGANNPDSGRSFNLGNLAPELIGDVQVFKTTEARLDEGGIGGTIIVNSRKPLSLKPNTLSVSVNYNENQRNKESDPRYSVFYSTRDESGRFGFLVNYAYNKAVLGSGSISTAYQNVCNASGWGGCNEAGTAFTERAALPTVSSGPALTPSMLVPQYLWLQSSQDNRERETVQVAFQYRPSDTLEFNLTGTRIDSDYSTYSQTFQTDLSVNWNEGEAWDARDADGAVLNPTRMSSVTTGEGGVTGGTGRVAVRMDEFYKRSLLKTDAVNLETRWRPGDWDFTANIGRSKATGGVQPEYFLSFYGNTAASWTIAPGGASLNLATPATEPGLFKTRRQGQQAGYVKTAESLDQYDYAKFDGKRLVGFGPFTEVLFGFKYQKHINLNTPHFYNTTFGQTGSMSDFATSISDPALVDGLGAAGDLRSFVAMTQQAVIDYSVANKSPGNADGDFRDAGNLWDTEEKTTAVYLQANFRSGKWHGDVGVRYAKTENAQTYRSTMDYEPWAEEMISIDRSYDDVLPSFNAAYDLSEDQMLRFSAGKVMSRPTFADMSGQVEYSLDRFSPAGNFFAGTGGNPNLQPYRAWNYSASYEWYFGPAGLFNIDLTYKDVQSYIVRKNTFIDVTLPEGALNHCLGTVNRPCNRVEQMLIYAPFNGSSARIPGVSVGWQGDIAYGFGIQTNVTWLDQKYGSYTDPYNQTAGKLPMPYLSKWSYTVSPYYEKGPVQARLSYTFRSKYTTDIGSESTAPEYVDGWGQLDASASYNVNDRLSINVAAQNLLDDMQHPYTTGGLPLAWSKYGTRLSVGVTYRIR